ERKGFVLLHDDTRKVPLWCAYKMIPAWLSDRPRLDNSAFKPDPDLPRGSRAELSDYRNAGFDRGHMVPSDDMRRSDAIQAECFYLSNMVPQDSLLNERAWKKLEERVRGWIKESDETYICAGPVFGMPLKTIGA